MSAGGGRGRGPGAAPGPLYSQKAVGPTSFYKCEACPYMALAEDDIKFHAFTLHPELARDPPGIACPGCSAAFRAEAALRDHLRRHHGMGVRDVRKLVRSLVVMALRSPASAAAPATATAAAAAAPQADTEMPQVIEIVPDVVLSSSEEYPRGVTVISVDELQKMSTPNFERLDPKEVIQEASINILYSDNLSCDYVPPTSLNYVTRNKLNLNTIPDIISSSRPATRVLESMTSNHSTLSSRRHVEASSCNTGNIKSGKLCPIESCELRMETEEKYNYHIACHVNGKLQCPECKMVFQYFETLHTHLWKTHNINMELYSCNICDYKTSSLARLNNIHKKIHEKAKDFQCLQCSKAFKSSHQLVKHKLTHKENKTKCPICMKELQSLREVKRHIITVHERKKPFHCSECEYKSARKSELILHIRSHTGEKPYKCDQCIYSCKDKNSMRRHKLRHTTNETYNCKHCPYTTFQSHCFKKHIVDEHPNHQNDDLFCSLFFRCSQCLKAFKSSHQLKKHKLTHKDNKTKCPICMKELQSLREVKRHIVSVHERKKPFHCSECEYKSARKSELILHIRSHTGEKPYKCDQCIYSCKDHNSMRRHKLRHSTNKTYSCKHCPYTTIQSHCFKKHIVNEHPTHQNEDLFCCHYCAFKSVGKDKFVNHVYSHKELDNAQLVELTNTPSNINWTTPTGSKSEEPVKTDNSESQEINEQSNSTKQLNKCVTDIPIELDDYDSQQEVINKNYTSEYNYSIMTSVENNHEKAYHIKEILTDLTKDDNNSDCIISESSNDTMNERHQCYAPMSMQNVNYATNELHNQSSNLVHGFMGPAITTISDSLMQNNYVNVITSNNSYSGNSLSTSIMGNFPIHLPPRLSIRRNLTLTPMDKIPLPVPKVMGPIITPNQILPVPSSSNSPVQQHVFDNDEQPKKKAKISVKSNLILKGPDQINMFDSDQNLNFARLQDNGHCISLSSPVTFNNLITTQFMQLPPEPVLNNNADNILTNILPFTPENILNDPSMAQNKNNVPLYTFNQQMNMLSQQVDQSTIICGNPSYIKLESKQNIQSPSLEKMCHTNSIINRQQINNDYCKTSPPLEEIHKNVNVNEIKNEVKSDTYFNMLIHHSSEVTQIDQHMIDTIIGANELYNGHLDLAGIVLPEISEEEQTEEIIEIDDNSEDNKLLPPRFDMNSLYNLHDNYFLDNDMSQSYANITESVNELNRIVTEIPIINQNKERISYDNQSDDFLNFIQGKKDPMMNTSVRPTANKINVKNIELMKN